MTLTKPMSPARPRKHSLPTYAVMTATSMALLVWTCPAFAGTQNAGVLSGAAVEYAGTSGTTGNPNQIVVNYGNVYINGVFMWLVGNTLITKTVPGVSNA